MNTWRRMMAGRALFSGPAIADHYYSQSCVPSSHSAPADTVRYPHGLDIA